ncbi:hypothetical protein [Staphylococcus equorum]|uniref:hypothetical protein n=1 Tax=Staphylococcus equorum TaxID=246432 RepID=UPI00114D38B7|nr:hypothetical protein [Staphylococcus equorum]
MLDLIKILSALILGLLCSAYIVTSTPRTKASAKRYIKHKSKYLIGILPPILFIVIAPRLMTLETWSIEKYTLISISIITLVVLLIWFSNEHTKNKNYSN